MTKPPGTEDRRADLQINCTRAVLDNGLTVLIHENQSAPEVSLSVCYRVGSKDEQAGQTGSAHLFEHLMFTGSANFPGLFSTTLSNAGATAINAYTTPDYTRFFETFPPGMLSFALYAEADRMGSFRESLSDQALDQQRQIVLEEKSQRAGVPLGTLPEIIRANLYPEGHPYNHPVIGSKEDIAGMTLAAARAWHAQFYTPDNAVVVIGGPVEPETALNLARTHFSHIAPSGRKHSSQRWIPAAPARRRVHLEAAVPHGGLIQLVWAVPEASDLEFFALELVANLLADDKVGPLHNALVVENDCLAISIAVSPGEVASEFTLTITLDTGADPDRMAGAARTALANALSSAADDDAFDRIRIRERTGLALSLDNLGAALGLLITSEMLWRDPLRCLTQIDSIETMEPETLRGIARRWLSVEPLIIDIRPQVIMPIFPTAATVRPALPAIVEDFREVLSPRFAKAVHGNGLKSVKIPRVGARDFVLRLDLAHGSDCELEGERGIGALLSTIPQHGIGTIDAAQLRELLDHAGLSLNIGITPATFVIEMHGSAAAAQTAAGLLNDIVMAPRFDEAVLADRKREQAKQLLLAQPDPMAHFDKIAPTTLYGADSWEARDIRGTTTSIGAIDLDALVAHHRRLFDPNGATLFVAGAEEAIALLGERLAALHTHWTSPSDPMPPSVPLLLPARQKEQIHFVTAGPDDQVVVSMAMLLPLPREVLDEATARALGFIFERRLGMRLRDELRWTYGVTARIIEASHPDVPPRIEIGGAVNAEHVAETIAEVEKAVADIAGPLPPQSSEIGAYVAAARAGITGSLVSTGGQVAAVAMALRPVRPADIRQRLEALDMLDADLLVGLASDLSCASPSEWTVASLAAGVADRLSDAGFALVMWSPN